MRPGAGYLPTLAPGRSRGCTTEPAFTYPGVARAGPQAGASRMTRLRSAPRRTCRIYSEEEFLAAEDCQVEAGVGPASTFTSTFEPEFALLGLVDSQREPRRWGRFAVLTALASVVAAVVGVVALNAARSRSESDRGFVARIAVRGGSPREIVDGRRSIRPHDADPRRRSRRASEAVRRVAEHRPRSVGRPAIPAHPYIPPQPSSAATTVISETAGTATTTTTAATATTATTPAAGTTATAPTAGTTAMAPTAAPPATAPAAVGASATQTATPATASAAGRTATAGGARAEFGFERR